MAKWSYSIYRYKLYLSSPQLDAIKSSLVRDYTSHGGGAGESMLLADPTVGVGLNEWQKEILMLHQLPFEFCLYLGFIGVSIITC